MTNSKKLAGHVIALLTITVWGATFVATKTLLQDYDALQIMLMRFFIAWIVMLCLTGGIKKPESLRGELGVFFLSLFGVTLYYYFENTSLSYTLASNTSIILASAPIFTAILLHIFSKDEKMKRQTVVGFVIAITGVALVVFNGTYVLKLNPLGDALAVLAALCWGIYSLLLKKYVRLYDNRTLTRKISFYALVVTAPLAIKGRGLPSLQPLTKGGMLFSILFLGVLGSALCYVAWNVAIKRIGVVNTNNYIYLNPFVTMVTAAIVLKEPITPAGVFGALLIVGGIVVSEYQGEGGLLLGRFYPKEYQDSIWQLDFEELYRRGFRGILFDVDNTLVPHDAPAEERTVLFFQKLHKLGFATCLISNNKEPRVASFAEAVKASYVYKAGKPKRGGYRRGMEQIGTDLEHTLFVGDQIFTDIWGANRTGIYSILVKPMDPKEEIQIVLKRYPEKIVLFFYQRMRAKEKRRKNHEM